jgi:hypothetical protein
MGRGNGVRYKTVGRRRPIVHWPKSQLTPLRTYNRAGANDTQIRTLVEVYGYPTIFPRSQNSV